MRFSVLHHVGLFSIVLAAGFACSSAPDEAANTGGVSSFPTGGTGATPATGGAGATATGGSGVGAAPSYCDPMPMMQTSCSGIICHGSPGSPAQYNTDFFNPPPGQTVGQMLMDKPADYSLVAVPAGCPMDNPELLINQASPSESLMLKKLTGTSACGVKMPNSETNVLTQDQIECFVSWVNGVTGHTGSGGTGSGGATTGGVGAVGAGGTGAGGGGGGVPPTFDTVKVILTQNVTTCVASDCHGGHEGRISLLVDDGLLGRLTSTTSQVCGMPVVTPGDPGRSALVKLLREGCGNVTPNCLIGTECIPRMPLNCADGVDCISEPYMSALEQWITAGAQP